MKVHLGLNVTDLEQSVDFYTKLFGEEPVKTKQDYAKFLPEHLALNFTINLGNEVKGNQVGHFGLQVSSPQELIRHKKRIEENGMNVREEENTTCCYALQDKFWISDPNGNEWEFFYTKEDVDEVNAAVSCC